MKANRSYRAGAQTAAEVIAADEAHLSYETLRKNRDAYIKLYSWGKRLTRLTPCVR